VLIYFYVFESMSRAKPSYVLGAEIRYAILDRQPADVSELTQSMFEPHSPFVLWFDDLERGKTLYYCVRWESTSGEKGPWSKIMDVMVP
jgi:hypothetical protein